jgi:hypothetical protein
MEVPFSYEKLKKVFFTVTIPREWIRWFSFSSAPAPGDTDSLYITQPITIFDQAMKTHFPEKKGTKKNERSEPKAGEERWKRPNREKIEI